MLAGMVQAAHLVDLPLFCALLLRATTGDHIQDLKVSSFHGHEASVVRGQLR